MTNEWGHTYESSPPDVREPIVTPIEGRLQRLMSGNRRSTAEFQQLQPSNGVLDAECGHLTRRQLNCQR